MRATERRQAILEALCIRRSDKVENLAFEFDVNESTIRRDILELSLNYPIYTQTGRYGGGVYVADDYYLGKQYLTAEQQSLLQELTQSVNEEQKEVLKSILAKFGKRYDK